MEQENIKNGGNGWRHGIGPDQQGAVAILAANMPIRKHRQAKRQAHGKRGDGHRENQRIDDDLVIKRVSEKIREILKPNELFGNAKGILADEGIPNRFPRRPEEKDKGNGKLRRQQQIGQQFIVEYRLALHGTSTEHFQAKWTTRRLGKCDQTYR